MTCKVLWDETERMMRVDFFEEDKLEYQRWYPNNLTESMELDICNWCANSVMCSGETGTVTKDLEEQAQK